MGITYNIADKIIHIIEKDKKYYMKCDLDKNPVYLCRVNELNSMFIDDISRFAYLRLIREKWFKERTEKMIYITGDTHGDFRRFSNKNFPIQKELTKDDYVIICGDFGGVWDTEESECEKYNLDILENRKYTTLFVDGNHENFDRLYKYPVEEWHGGKVHKIRPSVIHLMRGQVYEIEGKKFFTFGGASSHDINGGILEPDDPDFKQKKKALNKGYKHYRINHVSWWKEELPTEEEMKYGLKNLAKHNNKVDYIITHCAPSSIQNDNWFVMLHKCAPQNAFTDYLDRIKNTVEYKRWFFGHYHGTDKINKEELVYEKIIELNDMCI